LLPSKSSLLLNNSIRNFGSLAEEIKVLAYGLWSSTCLTTTKSIIIKSIVRLI
jgi:hypothetical protein